MVARANIVAHHRAGQLKYVIAQGSEYISENPLDFKVLALMADAYLTLGLVTQADQLYSILCSQDRSALFLTGLGLAKSSMGHFKEAKSLLKEALAVDPDYVAAWSGFAEIHRFRRDDPMFKRLQKALVRNKSKPDVSRNLHYLMCKAMNDMGKWTNAWRCAERGAALADRSYDPTALQRWHQDQAQVATAELLAQDKQQDVPSDGLIFIVGMPRSGTSLLETMLSNCQGVLGCGELCFVSDIARSMPEKDIAPDAPRHTCRCCHR